VQASPPRFMYNSLEIVKRHHAISVDVSPSFGAPTQFLFIPPPPQDIRELVLHIIADAPPPNWLKIEVGIPVLLVLCERSALTLLWPGRTPKRSIESSRSWSRA
jgi:hypothetical protein